MTDLIFDHTKNDMFGALGIKETDLKKFFVDVEEYMKEKQGKHSVALEFIWASDQSFEMKIASTFALGGITGNEIGERARSGITAMPLGALKELFKQMQKDGLL